MEITETKEEDPTGPAKSTEVEQSVNPEPGSSSAREKMEESTSSTADNKNESNVSNLSRQSAEEEVQRIREEMKKNLEARQEAVRKMKLASKEIGAQARSPGPASPAKSTSGLNLESGSRESSARRARGTADLMQSAGAAFGGKPKLTTIGMDAAIEFNKKVEETSVKPEEEEETAQQKAIRDMAEKKKKENPKRPLTKLEKRWRNLTLLAAAFDLPCCFYFINLGFVTHADDISMDPLAWQISFGLLVLLTILKNFQIFRAMVDWFAIWMLFVVPLLVGSFYGAVRYFLWIYEGDFPCFRGAAEMGYKYNMCYEGRLLVAFTTATLYLNYSAFFLWRWLTFTRDMMRKRGELVEELSIGKLLYTVEKQLKDQERPEIEYTNTPSAAKSKDDVFVRYAAQTGRIAGAPVRGRGRKASLTPMVSVTSSLGKSEARMELNELKIDPSFASGNRSKPMISFKSSSSQSIHPGSLQPMTVTVGASGATSKAE
mmetsp:Transcript_11365/g.13468  ORF Transcript_11365/g.13468 Transcript_11365/m.13468 type:complete len:488 (-) Transcript_11365:720-2183(-)|eukprot:CAMPEP_0197866494 /NCGR_PEP_ID=MMETSP1438-20131217/44245_1 /TAXON_ID=1461541 /ORGANISM="Pterosperma sp., Strain CCMP1384" /LENGTH=487 /DNA_ID=CAMNT_0043485065 /DNA_START=70 /DNA_END=1534 /DNA_ORIENTATION=-